MHMSDSPFMQGAGLAADEALAHGTEFRSSPARQALGSMDFLFNLDAPGRAHYAKDIEAISENAGQVFRALPYAGAAVGTSAALAPGALLHALYNRRNEPVDEGGF
jgi:hypothetical protein